MSVIQVLTKARELYAANPSHAEPQDMPKPGSHCVITALCDATDEPEVRLLYARAFDLFAREGCAGDVVSHFNADHTTDEVLAAFDRAITVARAES